MIQIAFIATAIGLGIAYAAAPGAVNTEAITAWSHARRTLNLFGRDRLADWRFPLGNPRLDRRHSPCPTSRSPDCAGHHRRLFPAAYGMVSSP